MSNIRQQILDNINSKDFDREYWYDLCQEAEQALFKILHYSKDKESTKKLENMIVELNNIRMDQYRDLNESTENKEWEDICKKFCEKIGAELLFVNDDNFGYEDKDGNLVHMYADELELYLKKNKLKENSLKEESKSADIVEHEPVGLWVNGKVYWEGDRSDVDDNLLMDVADQASEEDGKIYDYDEVDIKPLEENINESIEDTYNNLSDNLKKYLDNTDNVPTKEIEGTIWFNISDDERNKLKDFIDKANSIPEEEWRKWGDKKSLEYSSYANNADRIYRNSIIKDINESDSNESIIDEAARYLFDVKDIEDLPDYEEFTNYTMDITKDLFNKAKEKAIKAIKVLEDNTYYDHDGDREYFLELSDNDTINKLYDNGKDIEEWISIVNSKLAEFEARTGVEVSQRGRMGRHICVEPTYDNCINFDSLQETQKELEKEAIEEFNSEEINESVKEDNYGKKEFIDYCSGKVKDLGTVKIKGEDVLGYAYIDDKDEDKIFDIRVDCIYNNGFKSLNAEDTLEAFDLENSYLQGNKFVDGGKMDQGILWNLADLDFKYIDSKFYKELLDNWGSWEMPMRFKETLLNKNIKNESINNFDLPEGYPDEVYDEYFKYTKDIDLVNDEPLDFKEWYDKFYNTFYTCMDCDKEFTKDQMTFGNNCPYCKSGDIVKDKYKD